ncbi:zinc finger protein 665-like isoform X2 [Toxorhynchites rutilus septentrionalis]|uniref:zinc finger protein 665-like isoform X2 n=1 Tax=Toxorhynchites rutilus septentrionalis TaxID=329112 RepID=UPI0024783C44|nr:zinc finger protein 665-like isoform X2 [Toxorhynchites rutilus septentrionalis]
MDNESETEPKDDKSTISHEGDCEPAERDVQQAQSPPPMLPAHGLQSMFDTIDYLIVQDGYQCAACPPAKRHSYRDMPELRRHMVKHVNGGRTSGSKTAIRCNHCNRSFDRVDALRKHLLEALNKQYGEQADDDEEDDERDSNDLPVNYIVKNGCLTCSVCDAEFGPMTRWNKEKFKMHVGKEHWKTPAFKCHECGKRFTDATKLEKHMKRHVELLDVAWMGAAPSTTVDGKTNLDLSSSPEDPPDTKLFDRILKDPVEIQLEELPQPEVFIKEEPEDEPEITISYETENDSESDGSSTNSTSTSDSESDEEYPKKKPKSKRKYRERKRVKTEFRQIPGAESGGSIILACNLCDEGFLLQELLDRHMAQKHDDRERPYGCSLCSKTYMTNGNLQEHVRMVHSGVKFPCKVCGIKLSTKSSWKRHMKGHTEEGFCCDICKEKFSSHSVLAKHKRRVHEQVAKNYICVDCGNTYDSNAALREHRVSHTDERRWECKVCGMKFKRNHNLLNHKKTHLVEKPAPSFKCQECEQEFTTKSALAAHRSQHGKICCRLCEKTFETQSDLMQHRREDHKITRKEPGVSCRTCHVRCTDHEDLSKHRAEAHPMEIPLECVVCKATFASTVALRAHQREHQRVILYNCPNCSEAYNSQLLLNTHLKNVHADIKNHVCDLCGNGYPTRKQLLSHLGRHRNPSRKANSNMPGQYICDICGKEFNFRVTLKRHVFNFHMNQRKFQCEVCEKVLVSAEGLKLHMRSHSEDQLVMCELCGKGFAQPYRLREHMIRHARVDVDIRCVICNRSFRDPKKLELHLKSHTGETEFSCSPCQRHFATERHYRLHMKRMHESEVNCPVCDKLFPTEKKMKNHIRIHDNPQMFECPTCYTCIKDKKHFDRHQRMHVYEGVRLPCRFCPQTFSMPKTRRHHEARFHKDQQKILLDGEAPAQQKNDCGGSKKLKVELPDKPATTSVSCDFGFGPREDGVSVD